MTPAKWRYVVIFTWISASVTSTDGQTSKLCDGLPLSPVDAPQCQPGEVISIDQIFIGYTDEPATPEDACPVLNIDCFEPVTLLETPAAALLANCDGRAACDGSFTVALGMYDVTCAPLGQVMSNVMLFFYSCIPAPVITYSPWRGYCTKCGGCGVQTRKELADGVLTGEVQSRRCPAVRCPRKARRRKQFVISKRGRRIMRANRCCYSWKKDEMNPVAIGSNPYKGRFCGKVKGFTPRRT